MMDLYTKRKEGVTALRIDIMGVGFDNLTMDGALDAARAHMASGESRYCVTPNPEIVYEAMHDEDFRALLNGAALVLPDGVGIILGAKILGTPLREKVSGADFAERLAALLEGEGRSLYLLGGKPGVAEAAARKLRGRYPRLNVCGTADGYFRDEAAAIERVRAASPDVLFVCLGSPKQEYFMRAHLGGLDGCLMLGLGGTLDAIAGTVKRAPRWMQRAGLEWFYRLVKEPRRFKRMLRLPKFLFAVIGKRLKSRKGR